MKMAVEPECVRCGRCLAVCPIYQVSGDEKLSARGLLALIKARQEGRLDEDEVYARSLGTCLLCGACERVCTNGVPARQSILGGRGELKGGLKGMLRGAAADLKRLEGLVREGRRQEEWLALEPESGLHFLYFDPAANAPALAPWSLSRLYPQPVGPAGGERLLLFPGCLGDHLLVDMARQSLDVLAAAGKRILIPSGIGCCGLPALAAGIADAAEERMSEAAQALKRAAAEFSGVEAVVFLCAACGRRLKEGLPRLWPQAPPLLDVAQAIAGSNLKLRRREEKVAFFDPCHSLDPGSGLPEAARALISRLEGVRLVDFEAQPACCGAGGLSSLANKRLSEQIGRRLAEALASSGAETVATTCLTCLLRLEELSPVSGLRAVHLAQLAAARLAP